MNYFKCQGSGMYLLIRGRVQEVFGVREIDKSL